MINSIDQFKCIIDFSINENIEKKTMQNRKFSVVFQL